VEKETAIDPRLLERKGRTRAAGEGARKFKGSRICSTREIQLKREEGKCKHERPTLWSAKAGTAGQKIRGETACWKDSTKD